MDTALPNMKVNPPHVSLPKPYYRNTNPVNGTVQHEMRNLLEKILKEASVSARMQLEIRDFIDFNLK